MELQVGVLNVIPKCWQVTLKGREEWKELWRIESEMLYYVIQCENSYENTWTKWCKFLFVQKKWLKDKNGKEDGGFALAGNAKA